VTPVGGAFFQQTLAAMRGSSGDVLFAAATRAIGTANPICDERDAGELEKDRLTDRRPSSVFDEDFVVLNWWSVVGSYQTFRDGAVPVWGWAGELLLVSNCPAAGQNQSTRHSQAVPNQRGASTCHFVGRSCQCNEPDRIAGSIARQICISVQTDNPAESVVDFFS
jgi:hypothetical protein